MINFFENTYYNKKIYEKFFTKDKIKFHKHHD